jgi:hypothetical protein
VWLRRKIGAVGGPGQQVATQCQLNGAMAVGPEAVIANALETTRQGVLQEEAAARRRTKSRVAASIGSHANRAQVLAGLDLKD